MRVEDLRPRGAGRELRLGEKGDKQHVITHHALAEELHAYITAAGIAEQRKGWLVRTAKGWKATALAQQPMSQADAWRMIRQRAKTAAIKAPIGCPTFYATGMTAYLENGGTLEHAQAMAAHEVPRLPSSMIAPRSG